jgi:hypothetical protein
MKSAKRRRIDVNLEELDRVAPMRAPRGTSQPERQCPSCATPGVLNTTS